MDHVSLRCTGLGEPEGSVKFLARVRTGTVQTIGSPKKERALRKQLDMWLGVRFRGPSFLERSHHAHARYSSESRPPSELGKVLSGPMARRNSCAAWASVATVLEKTSIGLGHVVTNPDVFWLPHLRGNPSTFGGNTPRIQEGDEW